MCVLFFADKSCLLELMNHDSISCVHPFDGYIYVNYFSLKCILERL